MESAPIAEGEPQRLAALRSTALLDTLAEPVFAERIYRSREQLLGVAGWGAALFQPLLLREQPIGVLTVFWDDEPDAGARARAAR